MPSGQTETDEMDTHTTTGNSGDSVSVNQGTTLPTTTEAIQNTGHYPKNYPTSPDITQAVPHQSHPQPPTPPSPRVRRSGRIKSLETKRGGRKRREVIFSSAKLEKVNNERNVQTTVVGGIDNEDTSSSLDISNLSLGPTRTPDLRDTTPPPREPPPQSLSPVKLKSRWRNSLDAESLKSLSLSDDTNESTQSGTTTNALEIPYTLTSAPITHKITGPEKLASRPGFITYDPSDSELVDKLAKFEGIEENIEKGKKRKKENRDRGMVCDCFILDEDDDQEVGCHEETCLNRMLMVECGPQCPTEDRCSNKKFQRKEYCPLEVFKTEKKGHGLRTRKSVPANGFVIEYVGEVLGINEFTRRTKDYAKQNFEHFYFMALRSDAIIDATVKGNCSRFINHSCEPNCTTQKWSVNGELRIGFFALRPLEAGEEITFNYQFQRYGKEAQRCFCDTPSCCGWIGGDEGDEELEAETDREISEGADEAIPKEKPKRKYRPRKKKETVTLEDVSFLEDLARLEQSGLRNKIHTLTLCRLMVRAESWDIRERILQVLVKGDTPCLRLFLDYHGLKLLWGWMIDLPLPTPDCLGSKIKDDGLHILFINVLDALPIPNKTMLQDSKIISLIERWSNAPAVSTRIVKTLKVVPIVDAVDTPLAQETVQSAEATSSLNNDADTEKSTKAEELMETESISQSEVPKISEVLECPNSQSQNLFDKTSVPEVLQSTVLECTELLSPALIQASIGTPEEGISGSVKIVHSESETQSRTDAAQELEKSPQAQTVSISTPKTTEIVEEVVEDITWQFVEAAKVLVTSWADLKEVFRIPKKERVEQMKEHEKEADKKREASNNAATERPSLNFHKSRWGNERRVPSVIDYHYVRDKDRGSYRSFGPRMVYISKEERRMQFEKKVAELEEEQEIRRKQDEMIATHQFRCARLGLDHTVVPMIDVPCSFFLDPAALTWKAITFEDPTIPQEVLLIVRSVNDPNFFQIDPEPINQNPFASILPEWPEGLAPPPPLPPATLPKHWHVNIDDEGRCYYYNDRSRLSQWDPPSPTQIANESDSEEDSEEEVEGQETGTSTGDEEAQMSPNQEQQEIQKSVFRYRNWIKERAERRKKSGLVREKIMSPRSEEEQTTFSMKSIKENKLQLLELKIRGLPIDEEPIEHAVPQVKQEKPRPSTHPHRKHPHKLPRNIKLKERGHKIERKPSRSREREKLKERNKPQLNEKEEVQTEVAQELEFTSEPKTEDEECETENFPESTEGSDQELVAADSENSDSTPNTSYAEEKIPFLDDPSELPTSEVQISTEASIPTQSFSKYEEKPTKKHHHKHRPTPSSSNEPSPHDKDHKSLPDKKKKGESTAKFKEEISKYIVQMLNPYRKPECTRGKIQCTEDFKHLAKKITNIIILKELKHLKHGKTLVVNESVKHKTKEFIKKYMAKYSGNYLPSPDQLTES